MDPPPHSFAVMTERKLSIALGQFSTAGVKPENQDFYGALQPQGPDLVTKGIAVAIADGISTSWRGGEAAEIAVKTFLTDYYSTSDGWPARRSGETVIRAANSWMHGQNAQFRPREEGADREAAGLICTLSAIVLKGRTGHIFHVGDGRVARVTETGVEPLTGIHRVSLGGSETYLGRALGASSTIAVEYRQVSLREGDVFVLSTDGVHEKLSDEEMVAILGGADDLDSAAQELADSAAANGSTDNLTVQIVRVASLPQGAIDELLGPELRLPVPPHLRTGQSFEGYEILEQLHAGNRSHVWLARDEETSEPVVIKTPSTEAGGDDKALAHLMLEEWVMRRLSHPNLMRAAPETAPRRYLYTVSQHVPGMPLNRWMETNCRPPLASARKILGQVSAGLEAMHRRGILHRDLRPHNVMVDGAGHVTVVDFGSAQVEGLDEAIPREHEDGAFAGTIQYSAPELYLGHAASERSDVFSLGVIAYQMLTGELPYGAKVVGANTASAQRKLRYTPARTYNPDLPDWVDAALANALAVDPAQRCASPAELIGNLARPDADLLKVMPHAAPTRQALLRWQIIAALFAAALAVAILTRPDVSLGGASSITTTPTSETAQ